MPRIPKLLLFDIGGVLVNWDGIAPLVELAQGYLTPERARKFWLESPWVRQFEAGRCSPGEFARGVIEELTLDVSPEEFLTRFISWDRGPLSGAVELLAELAPRFTLACLSNNNELHWRKLQRYPGLLDKFQQTFVSYLIGKVKPDREVFEYVLSQVRFPKNEILFFDDSVECVEAAQKINLPARQAIGVEGARAVLKELHLLPR